MKIYFAWIGPSEQFDATIHNREDEKIFHLEIGQKEAGYARARVVIENPGYGLLWPQDKQSCVISFDDELVFRGRLIAMPCHIQGELVTLEFTAVAHDGEAKKAALCQDIKENGVYDRLFFSGEHTPLSELLQAYTALPYWSRTSGELSLSEIFKGRQHKDLGGNFFRDSLTISVTQEPLRAVHMELKAEWLQQAKGLCDLSYHIKRACSKGYLSTLTGESLERSWWTKKATIRQNGYRLQDSQLKKIVPLDRASYPATSHEFWHLDEKPKKVQFPRTWYEVQMRLGWAYRQKRREAAHFTLQHKVQDIFGGGGRTKSLSFGLASILGRNHQWQPDHLYTEGFQVLHEGLVYKCKRRHQSGTEFNPKKWLSQENHTHVNGQAARAEFFTTERGQQAIAYGLEIAKAYLAASARCITVTVRAHLNLLKSITLDHNLTLRDPRLPGGKLKGKVTGYRMIIDGKSGEHIAEVRLSVAIGTGISVTEAFPQEEPYAEDTILEENPLSLDEIHNRSRSALCFRIKGDQPPPMGIQKPSYLSDRNLVQHIEILNDADKQNRKLARRQYPHTTDLKGVLRDMPTDLRIRLKDLKTYNCLDRTLEVDVLTAWSAPQQIDLAAPSNQ
jgi:hypothetical protein